MMKVDALVRIDQEVQVSVDIDDLIDKINELEITHRYNYIARIFNHIDLGDILQLSSSQRRMITNYLTTELSRFENTKN